MAHAYIANHSHVINSSTRLFLASIISYVCALIVFVVDQLPTHTAYVTAIPTLAGTIYLYRTLFDIGELTSAANGVARGPLKFFRTA